MNYITVINFILTAILCIKTNKRLTAIQAIVCAISICLLARLVSFLINGYLNSISTDDVLVKSLIDVFKPYTIDSIWGEAIPVAFGFFIVAIVNKIRQLNSY